MYDPDLSIDQAHRALLREKRNKRKQRNQSSRSMILGRGVASTRIMHATYCLDVHDGRLEASGEYIVESHDRAF